MSTVIGYTKKRNIKKAKGIRSELKGPRASHYGMTAEEKKQYLKNLKKASKQ